MDFTDFILINPPSNITLSKDKAGGLGCIDKVREQKHLTPPMDMLYTAAVLESLGKKVEVIDSIPQNWEVSNIINHLKVKVSQGKIYIGIRLSLPTLEEDITFVNTIKAKFLKCIIFVFGNVIKTTLVDLKKRIHCDYILYGEPEGLIRGLMNSHDHKKMPNRVVNLPNINSYDGNNNYEWYYISNLNELPFPAWHLITVEKYLNNKSKPEDFLFYLLTSRGCPKACSMCPYYLHQGGKWRFRSLENIIQELKYLKSKFNTYKIQIRDPNFSLSLDRLRDICNAIINEKLDFDLRIETDLEALNRPLFELMKKAGVKRIMTGIESPDSELLAEINQKNNPIDKILVNIEICHSLGINILVFYMFGFPSQNWAGIIRIIKLNKKLKADTSTTILTPYPGTKFYDDVKKDNLLVKETEYKDLNGKKCIIRTKYLSNKDIELARNFCQITFYLQKKRRNLYKYRNVKKLYQLIRLCGGYIKFSPLFLKVYIKYIMERIRLKNRKIRISFQ